MKRSKLDRIDVNILKRLQEDGRVTNVELAKSVGISAPPCLRRVRVLKETGYIKSYHAKIDHRKLGYGLSVFASVKLKCQEKESLKNFEDYILDKNLIRECHMLSGKFDFLLKIVAKNQSEYDIFIAQHLNNAANIDSIESSVAIRPSKTLPGIPIEA